MVGVLPPPAVDTLTLLTLSSHALPLTLVNFRLRLPATPMGWVSV